MIRKYNLFIMRKAGAIALLVALCMVFSIRYGFAHIYEKDSIHIVALIDSAKVHPFDLDKAMANLDSARLLAERVHAKTLMADVLMEEGDIFTKNGLLKKADSVLMVAKNIMDSLPKNEKFLELIRRQAVCAYFEGDYQRVLQLAKEGLEEAKAQNNRSFTATFFNVYGVAYSGMGDQAASLRYYLKALDLFKRTKELDKIASVENNIGIIYQNQGNIDQAESYYKRSAASAKKIHDNNVLATVVNNLGNIAAGRNQYKKALGYFLESLALNRKTKNDYGIAMSLNNVGDSYLHLNQAKKAYAYFDSARILARKIGDNVTYSISLLSIAEYFAKENIHQKALSFAEQALAVSLQGNNVDNQMAALDLLHRLYAKSGNYKKAYSFLTQFHQLHDSLFSKEKNLQLIKAQKQFEYREKNREMDLAIQKKKTFQAYLIASILALLVVTGFSLFMIRVRVVKDRALKKQKQFVDNLLEESETHVLVLDKSAHNLYLSPSYEKHFGYKVEDRMGKNAMEFVHPEDQPALKALLKDLQQGEITRSELSFRLRNKKGEYREMKGIVKSMLNNPEYEGFILNFWDVSESRKAEKALAESEQKFRQIFNSISDIYFRLNKKGEITEISPSVKAVTGFESEEVIGKHADDFMEFPVEWEKARRVFARRKSLNDLDIMIKTKSGKTIHCSLNAHILTNDGQKIVGYEGTLRDINQRVEVEHELQNANESKDQILSIIGHDLMGPIGTQKALLDMMSDEIEDFSKEEMVQLLQTMRPPMDATFTMIENLLSWARIMRKNITPRLAENELYPVIVKVFDLLKQQARKKDLSLKYDGDPHFKCIFDKNLIEIVVRNLVSNAIKFSKKGDVITIRAEKVNGECQISVIDRGIGMDDEDIRKIFSETEKLESTLGTNREKGTGLGLIIVKEFIEKNHGKLYIKSQKGKGTTFTFILPMEQSLLSEKADKV